MKILVIGGGNMGLTYAKSIAKNSTTATISILENNSEKIKELKSITSFEILSEVSARIAEAEIILLAIKPQVAVNVFEAIKTYVKPSQLVISIMAGVTLQTISDGLNVSKVIRAMPNLPSQVGYGVTGYYCFEEIEANDLKIVEQILGATGSIIKVINEDQIDAITALSGSGPAYVFYFIDAMMKQAKELGFLEESAKEIVLNTFLGTTKLFESSSISTSEWIDRVTSKGGTTHAALTSFRANKIDEKIKEGVFKAYQRAKELAKK